MKDSPPVWVVDASVGIKLFLPEPYSPQARSLFENLTASSNPRLAVPDLFYVECANILWKYVRRFGYPAPEAQKNIADLKSLRLRAVPTAELMEKALDLAVRLEVTAYDACYLALAGELKAPLITADEKLFHRLKGHPLSVQWIGNIPLKH